MPPKASKKKEAESAVPNLPTINPVLNAAQLKFDKWVRRVQDLTRAKADGVREKSALVLTLKEGEAKLRGLTAEAEAVSQQALRPPPPPVIPEGGAGALPAVPAAVKANRKSQGNIKLPDEPEAWRPPEAAELRKLQKLADTLMTVYMTKRGGPDKPLDGDKPKKSSSYSSFASRRKPAAVDSPTTGTAAGASPTDATTPQESPQSQSLGQAAPVPEPPSPVAAPPPPPAPQPTSTTSSPAKGGKGKGKKDADKEAEKEEAPPPPQQMVSMSLAAGGAVVIEEPVVEPSPTGKNGKQSKAGNAKTATGGSGKRESVVADKQLLAAKGTPPLAAAPDPTTDLNTSMQLEGPPPNADGMERPKLCTPSQWVRILQLRQERLEAEEANTAIKQQAMGIKDRVTQLKEMEAISRYSLAAAQKELELLTGSPVAAIPGITAPLPAPAPGPITPRGNVGVPGASPTAQSLETSPKR